ncbi:MAG: glycosyltransferase family 4 protein [Verrucomicrobiales bacterium]|nr:glycosyltransferase family 4 protein [Verrucomicrobiales bacterium]
MRVLHDFQIFAAQRHGGISRYHLELLRELRSIPGVQPEIVLAWHESVAAQVLDGTGIPRGFSWRTPRFKGRFWLSRKVAEYHLSSGRYHLYHPTYYRVFQHPPGTRVALTVHDLVHELFPDLMTAGDPTVALRREALQRADVLLCVSECTRRDLLATYPLGDKPVVVTPLASGLRGQPTGRRFSQRPALLFVGPRGGYKNFALLRKAWLADESLRRDCALVCLGGEEDADDVRRLPGEVHRYRGDDQLALDLYASSSVMVYPSRYEGFGLPILEAMQFGCPVVTTRGGSIPEVAGDAAEYVEPDDVDALVAAIHRMLGDSALRERRIDEGRRRASHYTWKSCAERTCAAYRGVVGQDV